MMVIENEFEFGQTVYLKTDAEQLPRLVIAIEVTYGNVLIYRLQNCQTNSPHYDFEISAEKVLQLA